MLVMQAVNHRSGAEKKQRLKKSVRHQVENCRGPGADAQGEKHVTDLADGRIGQNAFDVALGHGRKRRHQHGDRANHRHRVDGDGRQQEQFVQTGNQVNARRDHGGRVDQRADRCRAGHRIRQPGLQGQLRGFAHGSANQQQAGDRGHGVARLPGIYGVCHHGLHIQRAQVQKQHKHADRHGRIADPGDHKSLARRGAVGRVRMPKADQQIAAQADTFPAHKQQQQVVGQHQHQHRRDKQVHIGKKPAVIRIVAHEQRGINMDQQADTGDHRQHGQGQSVDVKTHGG